MTGTEDFVILDTQMAPVLGATGKEYNIDLQLLDKNANYRLAFANDGILVYRRKSFKLQ
jgi:hypothetical protein